MTSPNAVNLLREVCDWLTRAGHDTDSTRDPASMEHRLKVYLEKDHADWPREYLEVRIRGELFYTWHIRATCNERKLLNTHVTARSYRFIKWLLAMADRPGPWPR